MLKSLVDDSIARIENAFISHSRRLAINEIGTVQEVGHGVARVAGLAGARADELLRFQDGSLGIVFNLDADELGIVLLGDSHGIAAGDQVRRTGRVTDVPVGEPLLGRVVDAMGSPLDQLPPPSAETRWPIERDAPPIIDRAPVTVPLATGIKIVDALVPIGRGQRELILGDRQTGKTAIALDTIINQKNQQVICVYCAIGQRDSAVAKVIAELKHQRAMDYTVVVVASGEDTPGMQFVTPYAATAIAEYFMYQGRDVVIVYDDLTRHARAYRELSLLLRRPPGREAYPGDIFYVHSRLLERATHLRAQRGGGSLTALPILETEAQNLSAYIPTNLISITDGQIYLSPDLFQKGLLPAIDIGKSVSRVGGKTQLPAYQALTGPLRLSYSQFEELELFARFGTRLDEETQMTIAHGRRLREILKQDQYEPLDPCAQIVLLLAAVEGLFDTVAMERIPPIIARVLAGVDQQLAELGNDIVAGKALDGAARATILEFVRNHVARDSEPA